MHLAPLLFFIISSTPPLSVTTLGITPNNDDDNDDDYDSYQNGPHLAVLPPVLPLELGGTGLKLGGSGLQRVCSVIQLRQLLVTFQHFVHIDTHDVHHLIHLSLRLLQAAVPWRHARTFGADGRPGGMMRSDISLTSEFSYIHFGGKQLKSTSSKLGTDHCGAWDCATAVND